MNSDVAVLGAGFSATAMVINLLEHLPPAKTISLVGARSKYGLGVAYSTKDENHRLNVPAGRMSLYADRPDHLVEWLTASGHGFGKEDFVPRQLFGRYVQQTLATSLQQKDNWARVTFADAEAINCERLADDCQVFSLSNGEQVQAAHTVFCLGGTPSGLPIAQSAIDPSARPHITINAWADNWLEEIDADATIFLLGSGLTTVDQVVSLKKQGHRGKIHILSRHGLLPQVHVVPRSDPAEPAFEPGTRTLSEMLQLLRRQARSVHDWRMVIDALRPMTQSVWQELDATERARFFRHANAWWSVHRHRMAPEIADVVHTMQREGQVSIHSGWLQEIHKSDNHVVATYLDRHSHATRDIHFDRIVNCTGMEKCSISKVPLLKKMAANGLIAADAQGLGLAVSAKSELLSPEGTPRSNVYAMGPMTVGQFFEIFAVPDIRVQAKKIAGKIALAA
ncbi:FAD/NAD(P)-binding protein [Rhizobium sp. LjRoot254]|uniref:FAD/NAD(P)-binding protein n=1 Tax=Rhizobium sp. LjRoot254 TaxID=3342297 RepID=UPI003ECD7B98